MLATSQTHTHTHTHTQREDLPCLCSVPPLTSTLDPPSPIQLQNQSELRAPTAERAAFLLDAAMEARSTNRADAGEEERRNSHMLFTLHVYQYRMEKSGKGGSEYSPPSAPL